MAMKIKELPTGCGHGLSSGLICFVLYKGNIDWVVISRLEHTSEFK